MIRSISAWFVLSIAVLCIGTGAAAPAEIHEILYPNESVHERYHTDSLGQRNGQYEAFHPNGAIARKGSYINGAKTGRWVEFDSLGGAIRETMFGVDGGPGQQGHAAVPVAVRPPKQGVIVVTTSDSTELLVDGKSIGLKRRAFLEMPPGRYHLVARREGYCDDAEIVSVYPDQVGKATFEARRWRLEWDLGFSLMHLGDVVDAAQTWPLHVGVQLGRHHAGASFRWSMFRYGEERTETVGLDTYQWEDRTTFFGFNLHYGWSALRNAYAEIRPGAAIGIWHIETDHETWEWGWSSSLPPGMPNQTTGTAFTLGPECRFAGGFEAAKIYLDLGYYFWLREDMGFFAGQDIWHVEWGFAWHY